MRTLSDGPTTRQKILVVSIWLFSAVFGILTCFPDRFVSDDIADPVKVALKSTIKPFINGYQDQNYAKGTRGFKLHYQIPMVIEESTCDFQKLFLVIPLIEIDLRHPTVNLLST